MKVIALTGAARAGKGTTAELIVDLLREVEGCYAKVEGFADRLKVSAARALGFDGDDDACIAFCDWLKIEGSVQVLNQTGKLHANVGPLTGRHFLQCYGTEAHRNVFAEDFWLDAVLPPTLDRNDCDLLVIHDLRFANEAQRVRDYGGEVWQVVRPGTGGAVQHVSEQGVDGDLVIDNRHGMGWLGGKVEIALEPFVAEFLERQQTLEVVR